MKLDNIDGDYMDKRWKAVLIVVLIITGAFLVFSRADNTSNKLYDVLKDAATGAVTILTPYILLLIFSILTTFGIVCARKRIE